MDGKAVASIFAKPNALGPSFHCTILHQRCRAQRLRLLPLPYGGSTGDHVTG
jgi:hypothetical protein